MASLPEGLPSLEVLVEQVRAPAAARADVDALLAGLSQPAAPGVPPRQRADLLLSLIEDPLIGDFTGSDDRTVRAAAVQALLELGYPYALEVPPEALDARSAGAGQADEATPHLLSTLRGKVGVGIPVLLGVAQLVLGYFILAPLSPSEEKLLLLCLAYVSGTLFLPTLLTVLGHHLRNSILKNIGNVWLVFVALLWMLPGFFLLGSSVIGLLPLAAGLLLIASIALMNPKDD